MSAAGLAVLAIGIFAARNDLAKSRGFDKLAALANVFFAAPLAVFGAEHFAQGHPLLNMVPAYMPGRLFWLYFVGAAFILAAMSIATKIQVRWSGLLVGIAMFLFVAMLFLPGAIRTGNRFAWTVAFRESSFGGAAWVFAKRPKWITTVGRVLIGMAAIFFAVEHFLHPLGLPAVPLEREMAASIPARAFIDYLTGAFLLVSGVCFLLAQKTRMAATYLGAWILLGIVAIYGPVLIGGLADPNPAAKIEGISYFADTLLFCGAILSLAAPITQPGSEP
jgi:uncharacterized membrane protein